MNTEYTLRYLLNIQAHTNLWIQHNLFLKVDQSLLPPITAVSCAKIIHVHLSELTQCFVLLFSFMHLYIYFFYYVRGTEKNTFVVVMSIYERSVNFYFMILFCFWVRGLKRFYFFVEYHSGDTSSFTHFYKFCNSEHLW